MRIAFASVTVIVIILCTVGAARFVALNSDESFSGRPFAEIETPKTAKVERGNLLCTINAVGVVKPEELVEVGAQVTGQIQSFGYDSKEPDEFINYGSAVRKGDILARIDPTIYKARVDHAEATIEVAKASLEKLFVRCEHLKQDWLRAKELLPQKAVSGSEYNQMEMQYEISRKECKIGKAVVQQNVATLQIAESNLENTIIKSPIDGVIVDRRVDIGQTVVASFNAPGLFLIAKDLRQMQVWASVDETDIAWIHPGLPVQFILNARPGETFEGKVSQIRLNAVREKGCASYTVVIDAVGSEGMLPYQTANVRFNVLHQSDVLLVPNKALRPSCRSAAKPDGDNAEMVVDLTNSPSLKKFNSVRPPLCADEKVASAGRQDTEHSLLIKEGNNSRTVNVKTGFTNGEMTEVNSDEIAEGMELIL